MSGTDKTGLKRHVAHGILAGTQQSGSQANSKLQIGTRRAGAQLGGEVAIELPGGYPD